MNDKDLLEKELKRIAKEKGLSKEQLRQFLAKVSLIEAGESLDPTQVQHNDGPGRGLGQWETNEGKGSNRALTSLHRARNYYNYRGEKFPSFLEEALAETKEKGTYDMSKLSKDQQLLVMLSDFRMGNIDLADLNNKDEYDLWEKGWWQGEDEDVSSKKELWNKRGKHYEENKSDVFNKLYDQNYYPEEKNKLVESAKNSFNIPSVSSDIEGNPYDKMNLTNSIKQAKLNQYSKNTKDSRPELNNNVENKTNPNSFDLGGIINTINSSNKNLNSFNGGGTHEQNRLGGIPIGKGANGKMNTVEEDETSFDLPNGKFIFSNRIGVNGYNSKPSLNTNTFAEGGPVNNTMDPPTKVGPKPKRDLSKLDNLFFDFSEDKENKPEFDNPIDILAGNETEKYGHLDDRFSEIHKESSRSCLAGALNCSQEFISKNSGLPGLRTIIANSNTDPSKYKVNSRDMAHLGDYVPNQSVDAWEIHDYLVNEDLGTTLFQKDKNTKYSKDSYLPKGLNYKDIPLGAVIGQGNSAGVYTKPSDGERSRHALTVVGFDNKDGMPMVYDYGKLTRLDKLNALSNKKHKINRVTVPNEYKGMTGNRVKSDMEAEKKRLGLLEMKPISYGSDEEHIQSIEKGVNEVAQKIAYNYQLPASTITGLSKILPGLSNQETKINNNEGTSESILVDNAIGNNVAKPVLKWLENAGTTVGNLFKDEGVRKQDYQLEIEA
ncbi:MAG: hypothetical protein ACTH0S_11500, partial [Senegalia sp. (in: firmicutes)]